MGWPELPCCGVFCNCDEEVTQMLNWTLVQILFQVDIVQDDKTHFSTEAVQLRAHTHTQWCSSRKTPTHMWATSLFAYIPISLYSLFSPSLSLLLFLFLSRWARPSTHTWGQREGVHIKAETSKEQDSQALMSDCPADSTHKELRVGNAPLLTYSCYIAIKLWNIDTIMHKDT